MEAAPGRTTTAGGGGGNTGRTVEATDVEAEGVGAGSGTGEEALGLPSLCALAYRNLSYVLLCRREGGRGGAWTVQSTWHRIAGEIREIGRWRDHRQGACDPPPTRGNNTSGHLANVFSSPLAHLWSNGITMTGAGPRPSVLDAPRNGSVKRDRPMLSSNLC